MAIRSTTTTTTNALSEAQRWALELAEAHGWGVEVQAADGARLQLRRGAPTRALVLFLSEAARAADEDTR